VGSPAPKVTTRGNREALLEGALLCLQERGFARTTARDIVAASGTNLGAIGYHYSSTERLLNEALLLGYERLFGELVNALAEAADDEQPLVVMARALPRTFERSRPLVRAWVEAVAQADYSEAVRDGLNEAYERGRDLLVGLLPSSQAKDSSARINASLILAVFDGLLIQWLLDPERAISASELDTLARGVAPALP
jgi:AcrR family transcriptional regulator